jgi:hypothetical protein
MDSPAVQVQQSLHGIFDHRHEHAHGEEAVDRSVVQRRERTVRGDQRGILPYDVAAV